MEDYGNTGKMSGTTINKGWFMYQEKEVFLDRKQKKLVLGLPNELEKEKIESV